MSFILLRPGPAISSIKIFLLSTYLASTWACATPSHYDSSKGSPDDGAQDSKIAIVSQDSRERVARVVSSNGSTVIASVALFGGPPWRFKEIEEVHRRVRDGAPLSRSFVESGFLVRKKILRLDVVPVGKKLQQYFETGFNRAKTRTYELWVRKGSWAEEYYGLVSEIYAPDSADPKWKTSEQAEISVPTEGSAGLEQSLDRIQRLIEKHFGGG